MVRTIYIPEDSDVVLRALLNGRYRRYGPGKSQLGGSIIGFRGDPYQRGRGLGGFLGRLFRGLLPIAKSAAKAIGKEALKTGVGVAGDVLNNRADLETSVRSHGKAALGTLVDKAKNYIDRIDTTKTAKTNSQMGGGRRRGRGAKKSSRGGRGGKRRKKGSKPIKGKRVRQKLRRRRSKRTSRDIFT